jgi:hypothetical protein
MRPASWSLLILCVLRISHHNFVGGISLSFAARGFFVPRMSLDGYTLTAKNYIANTRAASFRDYAGHPQSDQEHDQPVQTRMRHARLEDPLRSIRNNHSPGQRPYAKFRLELSFFLPGFSAREIIMHERGPESPRSLLLRIGSKLTPSPATVFPAAQPRFRARGRRIRPSRFCPRRDRRGWPSAPGTRD